MLWQYPGKAAWYFVTLPEELAGDIKFYHAHQQRGWGSLPVRVEVGGVSWTTSIFPDRQTHSFLLPIKKQIRQQLQLVAGDQLTVALRVSVE